MPGTLWFDLIVLRNVNEWLVTAQARYQLYQQTNVQFGRVFRVIQHDLNIVHTALGDSVAAAQVGCLSP
jgi:hypothetical protein